MSTLFHCDGKNEFLLLSTLNWVRKQHFHTDSFNKIVVIRFQFTNSRDGNE